MADLHSSPLYFLPSFFFRFLPFPPLFSPSNFFESGKRDYKQRTSKAVKSLDKCVTSTLIHIFPLTLFLSLLLPLSSLFCLSSLSSPFHSFFPFLPFLPFLFPLSFFVSFFPFSVPFFSLFFISSLLISPFVSLLPSHEFFHII